MNTQTPNKAIERLSFYRRSLQQLLSERKVLYIFSHELARAAGVTAAQVRRDMMLVGYTGSPSRGYEVSGLAECIGNYLDAPEKQASAVVGVGNLGRAILAYFLGRHTNIDLVASFDIGSEKTGRVIHGCRCYEFDRIPEIISRKKITTAIISVPAGTAQDVANALVSAGVKGILNFAPVHLHVPESVHVENVDIATLLEKVAFFSRN